MKRMNWNEMFMLGYTVVQSAATREKGEQR
jgi:hypothetical protein